MIELRNLTRKYGTTAVVDRLTLTVAEGELVMLLGASGSGKTTTLKMINRLIEPSSGTVSIDGEDHKKLEPHELRRKVGYVFQQVGLFPHMTVAENVGITPTLLGWNQRKIRARVDELLQLVELDPAEMRDRRPTELSGGQQQRVGVARALAAKPRVMLLDEPFGALDPLTRDRLQQSFQTIRKQLELTAVFVTHDVVEAFLIGDRIAVLDQGRLLQLGTARELMLSPAGPLVEELVVMPLRHAGVVDSILSREPPA